ncbi:MAG TPA: glycosyltransferase [Allosphingosinicella sp.]|nr:glycosyltransferase [Allosphingosinicella sp.]
MTKPSQSPGTHGRSVLYLSLDGMTDPLGGSQVLPYLQGLSAHGHRIVLLSCEKAARFERGQGRVRRICEQSGIVWHPLPYRRSPRLLAGLRNIRALKRAAVRLHRIYGFEIAHCRSYVPAMAGLILKRRFGVRLLFDMRGFWADERVDGRLWPQSHPIYRLLYRRAKALEAELLESADHVISLTESGRRILQSWPNPASRPRAVTTIPCCVDFGAFRLPDIDARRLARRTLGIPAGGKVVAYLGSIGTWYMLDEMLDFFACYARRHVGARLLFVTQDEPEAIRSAAQRRGLDPESLIIRSASREDVPALMVAADLGLFFIKPCFSKQASSPTKMGEMLALGLPIVTNAGVGDVAEIVAETGVGVAIQSFDSHQYDAAIDRIDSIGLRPEEIRARALPWFDVNEGIDRYDRVYRML